MTSHHSHGIADLMPDQLKRRPQARKGNSFLRPLPHTESLICFALPGEGPTSGASWGLSERRH